QSRLELLHPLQDGVKSCSPAPWRGHTRLRRCCSYLRTVRPASTLPKILRNPCWPDSWPPAEEFAPPPRDKQLRTAAKRQPRTRRDSCDFSNECSDFPRTIRELSS